MSRTWMIIAVLLVIVGLFWIGQGTNLLPGSAMSGSSFWAIVGIVLVAAGAGILWQGRRTSAPRP